MNTSTPSSPDLVQGRAGQALYLYGVVLPGPSLADDLTGVQGERVRAVSMEHVTALVSDVDDPEVIGRPAEVRAHAAVLDTMARASTVLPVRFGTTADDLDALASAIPEARQRAYAERLRELADVVQLSLTARFQEDAVIAELIDEEPEIRRLRDLTRDRSEAETYDARIRLGELVLAGFDRKRASDAERLERVVAPLVQDLRHREPSQVDAVLDVALLVRRDAVGRFEDALEDAAARLVGRITLRLVGPQAPYDFVEDV